MFYVCLLYQFPWYVVTASCSCALFCSAMIAMSMDCARAILDRQDVDIDCHGNDFQATALLTAVRLEHLDMVRLLLHHGARPDILCGFKHTAVMAASETGQVECLKLLLDHLTMPGVVKFCLYHQ